MAQFFIDENDLLLARRLSVIHPGVMFPGHEDLPEVPRGSRDDEWLIAFGNRRLVVITRDKRIRTRKAELAAWKAHGVRGFILTSRRSQNTADSLSILDLHWKRIQQLITDRAEGPWMYAVTSTKVTEIPL